MTRPADKGIIDRLSKQSVDQTVDKLTKILHSKGLTLFALVDHSGEAEKVGLKMHPTKHFVFGSPRAGTPLMLAAPSLLLAQVHRSTRPFETAVDTLLALSIGR